MLMYTQLQEDTWANISLSAFFLHAIHQPPLVVALFVKYESNLFYINIFIL